MLFTLLLNFLFFCVSDAILSCGPEKTVFSVEQSLPTSIDTLHILHDGMVVVSFFDNNISPNVSVIMDVEASSAAVMAKFKFDKNFTLANNKASLSVKGGISSTSSGMTHSPSLSLLMGASLVGLLGNGPWFDVAFAGACLLTPQLVLAQNDCLSADVVVMVPLSVRQVCQGTSVEDMRCVARSSLPAPKKVFFPNPRDMTLYQDSNNETTTTFFAGKDTNGLPTFVYQMNTFFGDPVAQVPLSTFKSTVITMFDLLPSPSDPSSSFSVVRRVVSDLVDFSFHYDVDGNKYANTTNPSSPSSFYVKVRSANSMFDFNTPNQSLSGVSLALLGQLPPRPASPIQYNRSAEKTTGQLRDIIGVQVTGNDGGPLSGSLVNFVVEIRDPSNIVLDRKNIAGVELAGGVYGARFPLFRAPTDNGPWLTQFKREATNHVNAQCTLVSAMQSAMGKLCDDVALTLVTLQDQAINSTFRNQTEAEEDANRTVAACWLALSAWKESCPSSNKRQLLSAERSVGATNFDSYTSQQVVVTPEMGVMGAGPVSIDAGPPISVPAGTSRSFPSNVISWIVNKLLPKCNALSVAGGDLPDTRDINFGASTGDFTFYYQTYTVRDQIDIFHGSTNLLSTGCVGQSSTVRLSLSPEMNSNSITVKVTPNCQGSTGTAWDYVVSCLGAKASLTCTFNGRCECTAYGQSSYASRQAQSPATNGCGASGSMLNPLIAYYIDDIWEGDFTEVCNEHDLCYGKCGSVRSQCDQAMCVGHQAVCNSRRAELESFNTDPAHCKDIPCDFFNDCLSQAGKICFAVSGSFGGQGPFESAQEELCACDY